MQDRRCVIILSYDLPMKTKSNLKSYRDFMKTIKKDGFVQMQKSVYSKAMNSIESSKKYLKRLKRDLPSLGNIMIIVLPINVFNKGEFVGNAHTISNITKEIVNY